MDTMRKHFWFYFMVAGLVLVSTASAWGEREQLKALIVDGQNNHDWKSTTPVLRDILEVTGLFEVEVATSPGAEESMGDFKPNFADYQVVVLNYNGADWPGETKKAFEEYVRGGGGVVVYHAADNSFPGWKAFNEMIGLGGWGNRDEKSGPLVRYREGKVVFDTKPGRAGSHGPQHAFQVLMRDRAHPITRGLPDKWMHVKDELYSELRGPAQNMTLLATAYADPKMRGTGEHEPALFTIRFGEGRIFHTTLGHDANSAKCVGFICTLQRGAEWAATGKVTQTKLPEDFPTAEQVSQRKQIKGGDIASYNFGDSRAALAALEEEIRGASPEKLKAIEEEMIKVLQTSGATYAGKQFACRMLRRIGTMQSIPVLTRLLADEEMSHIARFALEGMDHVLVGAALRGALDRLEGELKIGVISSMGARRDREAVKQLAPLVTDRDAELAEAAIRALGRIGGVEAARALDRFEHEDLRALQADAFLMCADTVWAEGQAERALTMYRMMLEDANPAAVQIAAYRGIIRCDQENAAATILSMLKNEKVDFQEAAGRFTAEAVGETVTRALASELDSLSSEAQVILLHALAERGDKAALSEVTRAAQSEVEDIYVAALAALGELGEAASVSILAKMSTMGGVKGEAAFASLCRLRGAGVDDTIMESVREAEPEVRLVLIRSMGERRNTEAVLMLLRMARFANMEVKRESIRSLGMLSGEDDVAALVGLLMGAGDDGLVAEVERAIMSVSNRLEGRREVSAALLGVLPKANVAEQVSIMRMLGRLGGPEALEALKAAVWNDAYNEQVRDEAIRSLSTWRDAEPAKVLIELARKSNVETHKVLALRGYIRMAGMRDVGSLAERQKMYEAAMGAAERAEEKRMILGAVGELGNSWVLEFLKPYLQDEAVAAEAKAAYARIVEAMNTVVARAVNAEIHGSGPAYERGRNRDCIGMWGNEEAWVSWEVEVAMAGVYAVEVVQSSVNDEAGSEYEVVIGEQRLRGVVRGTGDWGRFVGVNLGEVKINRSGNITVAVRPIKKVKSYVMNLRSVTLRRLKN